jgi:hypothetical protein
VVSTARLMVEAVADERASDVVAFHPGLSPLMSRGMVRLYVPPAAPLRTVAGIPGVETAIDKLAPASTAAARKT